MCGIFGVVYASDCDMSRNQVFALISKLFVLSESRGKEASGFVIKDLRHSNVYKSPESASKMLKSPSYNNIVLRTQEGQDNFVFLGHSRLVTNGSQLENNNNQPVIKDNITGVHNGIVCNVDYLWEKFLNLKRSVEVDTEVILSIFQYFAHQTGSFGKALEETFREMEGASSIALLPDYSDKLILATNNGSLYYSVSNDAKLFCFASEEYILRTAFSDTSLNTFFSETLQILPRNCIEVNIASCEFLTYDLQNNKNNYSQIDNSRVIKPEIILPDSISANFKILLMDNRISKDNREKMRDIWSFLYDQLPLRRCTRCLLPKTMTFIDFDENGVCNYCREHQKFEIKGVEQLKKDITPFLKDYYGRNCIVGISGGRDSCYGLHYIKNELGLNPISFTFDWAVVTDLSRRNISRMCAKLGIEHVVFSADINWKRNNIRKNINAWLKKPVLGMLPIIMAGDKEMLSFGRKMMKNTGLDLLIWCNGHNYEHTPFKSGFAGMCPERNTFMCWIDWRNKLRYFSFFIEEFLKNPRYVNSSVFDSFKAAMWQFILPIPEGTFLLYEYVPWDENIINDTLINEYNWELAPDTTTTWRIGDGTAAFYNYIYMTVAGITEHDTFRSSQIREGALTREKGFELIKEDNKPRFETIEWYANIIGFDVNKAIEIINSIPKHYV